MKACGIILFTLFTAPVALSQTVVCRPDAPANVKLAAKEIRRYVYLRTGELLPMAESGEGIVLKVDPTLAPQSYRLKPDGATLTISGGSDVGVLYGAYRYSELLGVRFQIDGDVIPDERLKAPPAIAEESGQPLFELRGLQPFHDFPEGPDWWTQDDWLSVVSQATKMRMNFIGLHTYPFHNRDLGPEPTVWVGLPEDVNADGTVKVADYSSWYTTAKFMPYGCYAPSKTGNYSFGGAEVFPSDDYGPEVNAPDDFPMPKTPAASVAMINRTGGMLKTVFDEARRRGMTIAVGTESPLDIPDVVVARLKESGMRPDDPATLQKLYAGMFTRIQRAYPIDHYWIWGHEGEIDQKRFIANMRAAHAALQETKAPFRLGICGWGWITSNFPSLDQTLPKDVFFSAISMSTGHAPVSENFARLDGRQKWAIPWFEDDGALTSIQLHAGRMRRDAVDARKYGCNGLMGLHWRTRVIAPNIAALAQAGWEQGDWSRPPANPAEGHDVEFPCIAAIEVTSGGVTRKINCGGPEFQDFAADARPETTPRDLPVADFYEDWATGQFGREAGPPAAAIFAKLDGNFPQTSAWINGPGAIAINQQPWASVAPRFGFVDEFAALRPLVRGPGHLERFDWWLNTFRVTKLMGEFGCERGQLDGLMKRLDAEKDGVTQRRLAREQALPVRLKMVTLLGGLHHALLATLNNATELGTLCNLQQQSVMRLKVLGAHDAALEKYLGEPLPAAAQPWKDYRGDPRLVVMTARTTARPGEALALRIVALDRQPVKSVTVKLRPLGQGEWHTLRASHQARALWRAKLPPVTEDFEYFVESQTADAKTLRWPTSAPQLNQTVVIAE